MRRLQPWRVLLYLALCGVVGSFGLWYCFREEQGFTARVWIAVADWLSVIGALLGCYGLALWIREPESVEGDAVEHAGH